MDDISPQMALAVMAAEDQKFPDHWGFDVAAIEKALSHNEKRPTRIRGASTLSQQTAKNLFLWDGRSWLRKGLEAGLTSGIELVWTKRRILTVYLEHRRVRRRGVWRRGGITTLFHKPAKRLTAAEAALLAAVLPNPHRFRADAPSGYVDTATAVDHAPDAAAGREAFLSENKWIKRAGTARRRSRQNGLLHIGKGGGDVLHAADPLAICAADCPSCWVTSPARTLRHFRW